MDTNKLSREEQIRVVALESAVRLLPMIRSEMHDAGRREDMPSDVQCLRWARLFEGYIEGGYEPEEG